jgi:fatty-acyl-CoA synthase
LRLGDACVFSVDGLAGEEVVVLVQCFPGQKPEIEELVANIRQVVKQTAGVDCRIVLLPRRIKLPQTSSGKLSRALAKRLFLNDELDLQTAIS